MAHRRIVDPYEKVYADFRGVVETAVDDFGQRSDIALLVGCAQAEALVRTLRGMTLRGMSRPQKAEFISWLLSQLMSDLLEGQRGIVGKTLVRLCKVKKR